MLITDVTRKPLPIQTFFAFLFIALLLNPGPSKTAHAADRETAGKENLQTIIIDSYQPYTFVNDKGEPDGFSIELLRAVARETGRDVVVRVDTWANATKALEQGTIDVLSMMAYSPERAVGFDFSPPHTIAYDAIFQRQGGAAMNSLNDLAGKTVIVMNEDIAHQYLVESGLSKAMHLHAVDSLPEAIRQLAAGTGDAAIMPKLVGMVTLQKLGITTITASSGVIAEYERPFGFAVRKGNHKLLNRLNAGLRFVKASKQYDEIYRKWFARLEDPHIEQKTVLTYAAGALLAWAVLVVWSIALRRQVRTRTKNLEAQIHQRKMAEDNLLKLMQEQEVVLENAPVGIFKIVDRKQVWVNRRAAEMLLYTREELVGQTTRKLYPSEEAYEQLGRDAYPAISQGQTFETERTLQRRDGTLILARYIGKAIQPGNPAAGTIWIVEDITERRRVENALIAGEERLQLAVQAANIGIWDWDVQKNELTWDDSMYRLYGIRREEFGGAFEAWTRMLHPDDLAHTESGIRTALRDKREYEIEFRIMRPDGEVRLMKANARILRDGQGDPLRIIGTNMDITDARRMSEKLWEFGERSRIAIQEAPYPIMIHGEDGKVVMVNRAWTAQTGYAHDDILTIERWADKAFGEQSRAAQKHIEGQFLLGREAVDEGERNITTSSGAVRTWEFRSSPLGGHADGRRLVITMARDVTEKKKAEAQLRKEEARLQCLVRLSQHDAQNIHAFLDYALQEAILLTSSRIGYIYFYRAETQEFILNSWSNEVMQECSISEKQTIYQLGKTGIWGEAVRQQRPIILNDFHAPHPLKKGYPAGHAPLHKFMTVPVFSHGQIVAVVGLANKEEDYEQVDVMQVSLLMEYVWKVVQRHQAESELMASEDRFRTLFENATSGVALHELVLDERGEPVDYVFLQVNPSFERFTGLCAADIIGKRVTRVIPGIEKSGIIQTYGKTALTGVAASFEMFVEQLQRHYAVSAYQSGKNRFAVVFDDVTQRKQQEEELRQKSAEVERFTYTASHDLRSPLVTVKAFLGFLRDDLAAGDRGKIETDIEFMTNAANKMGVLLDELLEVSRIGRVVNDPVRASFREVVDESLGAVAGRISEKNAEIIVGTADIVLYGDRPRLAEVWQNLVENAAKYMGDQLSPRIEIGAEGQGADTVFFVRDNGMGIDPRHQSKVFGLFDKLDAKSEGSGLGLALVKRIVEMYQGKIWVESEGVGKGSTFKFTLPGAVKNN